MMAVSMMGLLMLSACQTNKNSRFCNNGNNSQNGSYSQRHQWSINRSQNPQKVVVFDNGSLDTMDALGVGDRVVGAPTKNIPAYLKKYQKVESAGGIKEPDLEKSIN